MKGQNILYTVKEVAEFLKTNIDYVHKLRKSGLLPFLKIGQYKLKTFSNTQYFSCIIFLFSILFAFLL